MPRQNRVTPMGDLVADGGRGLWMGNRGCLHDERGRLTGRRWTTLGWVTCRLSFKGRHRSLMQPRRYTELFFLDEPTAFAAGHRPCGECRRQDYLAFRGAWFSGNGVRPEPGAAGLALLDRRLHEERSARMNGATAGDVPLDGLPDGAMILFDGQNGRNPAPSPRGTPHLVWGGEIFPWRPQGYAEPLRRPRGITVQLVTPPSTVAAFHGGYRPAVHSTADSTEKRK